MTQKDYIKIAKVLRETKTIRDKFVLVSEFSLALKVNNPKFDANKFYKTIFDVKAF